jgi:hypothetical protein
MRALAPATAYLVVRTELRRGEDDGSLRGRQHTPAAHMATNDPECRQAAWRGWPWPQVALLCACRAAEARSTQPLHSKHVPEPAAPAATRRAPVQRPEAALVFVYVPDGRPGAGVVVIGLHGGRVNRLQPHLDQVCCWGQTQAWWCTGVRGAAGLVYQRTQAGVHAHLSGWQWRRRCSLTRHQRRSFSTAGK